MCNVACITLVKPDQANLMQRFNVNQTCPLSCLVALVTTKNSQKVVIIQCCVRLYTLFVLLCTG